MNHAPLPHQHSDRAEELRIAMPGEDVFRTVSDAFKLLSDPTRMQLYWLLCHCEECVLNLGVLMNMSSPAISHHLKLLKATGLITSRREGKEVYYTVARTDNAQHLHQIIEKMIRVTCPSAEGISDHS